MKQPAVADATTQAPLETANQAFANLAAQNARAVVCKSRSLASVVGLVIALAVALVAAFDHFQNTSGARHASALKYAASLARRCDASLKRRRFWIGPQVVSHALCVSHATVTDTAPVAVPHFSFLVVGDWGRDGMCCQRDVAVEMAAVANRTNPAFIVSTGDNFYKHGIVATTDAQVATSWRDVYITPHPALRREWKVVLGNHDYAGNPIAQTQLSSTLEHWHLPNPYYFETVADGQVFIAFIDTICMFYRPDQMHQYHGDGTTPEYRARQLEALESALSESKAPWKLVVGHHPLFSSGRNSLKELDNLRQMRATLAPILKKYHVAAYFCGHEHSLEHHVENGLHMFISGGGSKVGPLFRRWEQEVFSLDRQGFAQVSFEKDAEVMRVTFYDLRGATVHDTLVKRPAES